jgi:NAD(P)-dependent dehydrogenase (short-subunit alcohol dehydrogenase family)
VNVRDKVVVVTGGASGIGAALCRRFAAEGARSIVVSDLNEIGARVVANEIGGLAVGTDVSVEVDIQRLVRVTEERFGSVDLFCSNAGIAFAGDLDTPDSEWKRIWDVNLMSHIFAARAVVPGMMARGGGYLLQTASAAGLLSQIGSAPYAVSKHAAVAFAEWLAITYGERGIGVSCLCPQGVVTPMLTDDPRGFAAFLLTDALTPEAVADAVITGLAERRFLILPHPRVHEYLQHKVADHDRWIRAMQRLQAKVSTEHPG